MVNSLVNSEFPTRNSLECPYFELSKPSIRGKKFTSRVLRGKNLVTNKAPVKEFPRNQYSAGKDFRGTSASLPAN